MNSKKNICVFLMNFLYFQNCCAILVDLESNFCFEFVFPFDDNLRVHYDRDYLLNGGIPELLRGGLFLQGPHKAVGKGKFSLTILGSISRYDRIFMYVFFHSLRRWSGCLDIELQSAGFTKTRGPGIPYDVMNGNHGIPSQLWYKELGFGHEKQVIFHLNTRQICRTAVFGVVLVSKLSLFNNTDPIFSTRRCARGGRKSRKKTVSKRQTNKFLFDTNHL